MLPKNKLRDRRLERLKIFPSYQMGKVGAKIAFFTDSPDNLLPTYSFHSGSYVVNPAEFSLTITNCPHIANYVRSVCISVGTRCVLDLSVISPILSKLSQLSQIKSIAFSTNRSLPWGFLDPEFRTAFQNECFLSKKLPYQTSVLFPSAFSMVAKISNTFFSQYVGAVSTSAYPRLCSLGVGTQGDSIGVVSWMNRNSLHTLSLQMYGYADLPYLRTLIKACSATLVNLKLDHHRFQVGELYFSLQWKQGI